MLDKLTVDIQQVASWMIAHVYFPVQMYEYYIKGSALNSGLTWNCMTQLLNCSNLEISFWYGC